MVSVLAPIKLISLSVMLTFILLRLTLKFKHLIEEHKFQFHITEKLLNKIL